MFLFIIQQKSNASGLFLMVCFALCCHASIRWTCYESCRSSTKRLALSCDTNSSPIIVCWDCSRKMWARWKSESFSMKEERSLARDDNNHIWKPDKGRRSVTCRCCQVSNTCNLYRLIVNYTSVTILDIYRQTRGRWLIARTDLYRSGV